MRSLEEDIARRWRLLRAYAASSPERRQAIEGVLLKTMGDDDLGQSFGEALVAKLGQEIDGEDA